MAYKTIIYKKEGRIVFLTLNRPETVNALNLELIHELNGAWEQFKEDDDAWVVVLSGAGKGFCSGLDRTIAASPRDGKSIWAQVSRNETFPVQDWGPRIHKIIKPVVVAIHGVCCGGGLDFISEGDIVIVSEDATFFDPHVSIGLVSGHESIEYSRRLPTSVALQMALMGNSYRMTARRAYELGFVNEVVTKDKLLSRAREIADAILQNSPLAVRLTKQAILNNVDEELNRAIEFGEYVRRENVGSGDMIEGMTAFAQKRKPLWKGK